MTPYNATRIADQKKWKELVMANLCTYGHLAMDNHDDDENFQVIKRLSFIKNIYSSIIHSYLFLNTLFVSLVYF